MAGFCENGIEAAGSTKGDEFTNWLSDYQLVKI
jgi:hypothetical protein